MIYSPEFHTTYVTGDATFHPNDKYDPTFAKYSAGDTAKVRDSLRTESVDRYKYLVGTSHVDPDNGLLYKVLRVEEKNYRGQGTFIVAYRAQVFPDGRVSTKCDKDAYHVRDIEKYYEEYKRSTQQRFPRSDDVLNSSKSSTQGAPSKDAGGVSSILGKRTRSSTASVSEMLPLFYDSTPLSERNVLSSSLCNLIDDDGSDDIADDIERELCVNAAVFGDGLMAHCLATGSGVTPEEKEPNTIKQAYALPDRDKWREAVDAEMEMIRQFNVFSDPMPLPQGAIPLTSRWMFKRKRDHLGNVIKYKARLTPQGCYQHFGVDYSDTYAPVARMATLRFVLALACLLQLRTSSCDFTNAFLNAELKEDVYISAPPGTPPLPEGYVYKLQRALYGLKQSPREWNNTLNSFMTKECGFRQLQCEKCLYIKQDSDGSYMVVCMYVDDLVIAYSHRSSFESSSLR